MLKSATSFAKCQLPIELFNVNRMVKTKIKQSLGRVGYLMLRDGTIELKGDTSHLDLECAEILQDLETNFELEPMSKPDYFAPY